MEKRIRTEITFETDRTLVITTRPRSQTWCADCARLSKMVTAEQAANATGLTSSEVGHTVEIQVSHDGAANGVPWEKDLVQGNSRQRTAWVLTAEVFEKLLHRLDENREHAGDTYEKIRLRLMKYFECRGSASPEEHADETIDRVARRISEGSEIWTSNPASYFYGVARNVLREYWDSPERDPVPIESTSPVAEPDQLPSEFNEARSIELRLQALDRSLHALSAESRELILEYYRGDKRDKIRNRKNLAKRFGIPLNALRIKAHRIREKLERSVTQHLAAIGEMESDSSHKGVGEGLAESPQDETTENNR